MMRFVKTAAIAAVILMSGLFGDVPAAELDLSIVYALENGDVNGDLERDIGDGIYLMHHLFLGGPEPVTLARCAGAQSPSANGDTNGDGQLDMSDGIRLFDWLYLGGEEPVAACYELEVEGSGACHRGRVRILPPRGRLLSHVYSVLAGAWWQWALAIPFPDHPLNPDSGAGCDVGQSGPVWYLGGSFGTSTVVRECTIPGDKFVCFPIINTECSSIEVGTDFFCDDETSCLACNGQFLGEGDTLSLTIDGRDVDRLEQYRVQSGLFDIDPLPADNLLGAPEGTTGVSLADGYYVLLAPLPRGEHTIHFVGCFGAFGGCEGFELDVTYHITVE